MVITKLQGGLGNQMFQYATARGIAGKEKRVYLDHSALEQNAIHTEHFTARKYALGVFRNLKADRAAGEDIKVFFDESKRQRLINRVLKRTVIRQVENEFFPKDYLSKYSHYYLDGYFQSEKYFSYIRPQLLKEFELPELDVQNKHIQANILGESNAVSIHIRRGDYLRSSVINKIHGVLPLSYYNQAIDTLKSKFSNLSLFLFSEDTDWVRDNLQLDGLNASFISGNNGDDSWKDMALMKYCKHHIIANSSFSWWGAWLSERQGDVIAPANWFNADNVRFDIHDFIPDRWTILN